MVQIVSDSPAVIMTINMLTTDVRSGMDWIVVIEYWNEDIFYSAIQQKWKIWNS
jgi:hypothetical protein